MRVTAIHVSTGHNFFGHFGQAPGTHRSVEVPEVECVAGRGLRGDRFFDYKPDYKGQVTFFDEAVYAALCHELRVWDRPRSVLRRNVFVAGTDLNTLIGHEFTLQGIRFHGSGECSPCLWMNEAFGTGAENFLKGRGGLRARILDHGMLRIEG